MSCNYLERVHERSVAEMELYFCDLEMPMRPGDDDNNEWRVRFESQITLNKRLEAYREWLESELREARRMLATGSYPEALNFNLDTLNETELQLLVKHLDRMRNELCCIVRDMEWKIEKESKEFHQLDEIRRVYKASLKRTPTN